jgi:hypothetical protein
VAQCFSVGQILHAVGVKVEGGAFPSPAQVLAYAQPTPILTLSPALPRWPAHRLSPIHALPARSPPFRSPRAVQRWKSCESYSKVWHGAATEIGLETMGKSETLASYV